MGTTIRGKTRITPLLGTEAIPVNTLGNADGYVTAQDIANLVAATGGGIPVYNVRNAPYSAVGDGSTDDSTACQNAINACQAGGGGLVYFPPGVYALNTAGLLVTGSGVTLLGANQYATYLKVPHNAAYPGIELRGNSGSRNLIRHQYVQNMTVMMGPIDGSGAASSGTTPGIKVSYGVFQVIEDTNVFFFQTGIYGVVSNNLRTRSVFIVCETTTSTCYGVYLDNAGGLVTSNLSPKITYTEIDLAVSSGTKFGVYIGNGGGFQDFLIDHCETDDCTYGLYLDGGGASGATVGADCHVDHHIADQCIYGLVISNAGSTINTQIAVNDFYWSSAPSGVAAVAVITSAGVHIRGLQAFAVNGGDGVQFSASSAYCTVTDGQFNSTTNGVTSTSNCASLGVNGNTFMPGVTTPINLNGAAGCKGRGNISSGTLNDFG